jgi:hypothetical protein
MTPSLLRAGATPHCAALAGIAPLPAIGPFLGFGVGAGVKLVAGCASSAPNSLPIFVLPTLGLVPPGFLAGAGEKLGAGCASSAPSSFPLLVLPILGLIPLALGAGDGVMLGAPCASSAPASLPGLVLLRAAFDREVAAAGTDALSVAACACTGGVKSSKVRLRVPTETKGRNKA